MLLSGLTVALAKLPEAIAVALGSCVSPLTGLLGINVLEDPHYQAAGNKPT